MDRTLIAVATLTLGLAYARHRRAGLVAPPDAARRSLGLLLLAGAVWVAVVGRELGAAWR